MDDVPSFGLDWSTAGKSVPLIQRRLYCARHNRGDVPRWEQRKEIIKALWSCSEPGEAKSATYAWHRWNEKRLRGTCSHNWNTWAGPGGSGKTSDAAMLALEWWLEAPHESAVIVCSTTKDMLRKRVWAQISHFHNALYTKFGPRAKKENQFGELIDSETKIRWRMGDDKNCIFGLAVGDGPVEEAINNLIGIHTTRVWLILDEMQGVRAPIVSPRVLSNLSKNPESYFLGMGNPESLNDPLGIHSEPLGGWASITLGETQEWETRGGPFKGNGLCQAFNGMDSPADDSAGERKRLHWLTNRDQIQNDLNYVGGNDKDPSYLSQSIGIWPMAGLDSTVLDDATITTFHCKERAQWTQKPTDFASLDPSFEGKDECILQFGKRGLTEIDGALRWMVDFGGNDWERITVVSDSSEPIHHQIARQVKEKCEKRKIPPQEFALDSTGEGGGLMSILRVMWGPVIGVEFGGKPTDMPVSETNPKPSHEHYDRRASELNISVRTFAQANCLRGLSNEACVQACARKTEYKGKRFRVETKTEMKKRIGRSPDNLDAVAVGIDLCRQKGVMASSGKPIPQRDWRREQERAAQEFESGYEVNEYA